MLRLEKTNYWYFEYHKQIQAEIYSKGREANEKGREPNQPQTTKKALSNQCVFIMFENHQLSQWTVYSAAH